MPFPFINPYQFDPNMGMPDVSPGMNPPMNPIPDMSMPDVYGGVIPPVDINQMRMQELFNPQHSAQDRLNQILGSIPQRQPNSFMSKIVASLAGGAGGVRAADQILDAPFNRQLHDWQTQYEPAYQAANLERYNNSIERQYSRDAMMQDKYDKDRETRVSQWEAQNKIAQDKVEIAKFRAAAYDYKARNPNHIIKEDNQGYLIGVDPQTGIATHITTPDGTPLLSSRLPDRERLEIMNTNRLGQIAAQGDEVRKTEGVRQGGRLELENTRQGNRTELEGLRQKGRILQKTIPPPTRTGKISEYQIKQGRVNRAAQLQTERPDLADYIHIQDGIVTLDSPKTAWYGTGPSPEDHELMRNTIYGSDTPTESGEPKTAPPITPGGPQVKLPPPPNQRPIGMIWTFPNGKKGKWDGKGWVAQ